LVQVEPIPFLLLMSFLRQSRHLPAQSPFPPPSMLSFYFCHGTSESQIVIPTQLQPRRRILFTFLCEDRFSVSAVPPFPSQQYECPRVCTCTQPFDASVGVIWFLQTCHFPEGIQGHTVFLRLPFFPSRNNHATCCCLGRAPGKIRVKPAFLFKTLTPPGYQHSFDLVT